MNRAQTMKNTAQSVLLAADINTNTGGAKEIALTECITVENDTNTSHTKAKSDQSALHTDADSITDLISLIPGEAVISVDKMRWCVHVGRVQDPAPQPYPGCMVTTNYRVVLLSPRKLGLRSSPPSPVCKKGENSDEKEGASGLLEGVQCCDSTTHSRYGTPRYFSMTSVPLSAIFRLYVAQPRNVFCIVVKDFRVIRIVVSSGVSGGLKSAVNMTAVTSSSSSGGSSSSSGSPLLNGASTGLAHDNSAADSNTAVAAGSDGIESSKQSNIENSAGARSSSSSSSDSDAAGSVNNAKRLNGTDSDHCVGDITALNGSVGIDIQNKMNGKIACRASNSINTHSDTYSDSTDHNHNVNRTSSNGNDNTSISDSHYNKRDTVQNVNNSNNSSNSYNNNNNNNNNGNNNTANSNNSHHNNSNINSNNSITNGTNNILNQSNYRSTPHSINNGPLSPTRAESLVITLNRLCFQHPSKPVDRPFAYRYAIRSRHNGWSHSDIIAEYRRQGLLDSPDWKVRPFSYCQHLRALCACLCVCVCQRHCVCVSEILCVCVCCMHSVLVLLIFSVQIDHSNLLCSVLVFIAAVFFCVFSLHTDRMHGLHP